MARIRRSEKWLFDLTGLDLVSAAPFDRAKAREALLAAAQCLDDSGQLSRPLASYLVRAIRKSLGVNSAPRVANAKLLEALGLTAGHRRQIGGDWYAIGKAMEEAMDEKGMSRNAAARHVGRQFKVAQTTAIRRYMTYGKALKEYRSQD